MSASELAKPLSAESLAVADDLSLTQRLDRWALLFSGVCLIHCLALPLALSLLPILAGTALGDHHFHEWLFAAILPTSVIALTLGCRRHGGRHVIALGGMGLSLLAFAAFAHEWSSLGMQAARWLTSLGGVILATGHVLNFRLCRDLHHQRCNHG